MYAHPKWIIGGDGSVEALEVQYLTLYAFNGAYNVGGLPFIQTGAHDGDWEHCTARSAASLSCMTCSAACTSQVFGSWPASNMWRGCAAVSRFARRLHPATGELIGLWYNAHRSRDGSWVAGPEVRQSCSKFSMLCSVCCYSACNKLHAQRPSKHECASALPAGAPGPSEWPHRCICGPARPRSVSTAGASAASFPFGQ